MCKSLDFKSLDIVWGPIFAEYKEVAGTVAFLVSKDAAYVLGHALVMDGGYIVH
jgi:NAD(P)-dependent dehydrogenase (short-subunit alcohol dehydrogenase family)